MSRPTAIILLLLCLPAWLLPPVAALCLDGGTASCCLDSSRQTLDHQAAVFEKCNSGCCSRDEGRASGDPAGESRKGHDIRPPCPCCVVVVNHREQMDQSRVAAPVAPRPPSLPALVDLPPTGLSFVALERPAEIRHVPPRHRILLI